MSREIKKRSYKNLSNKELKELTTRLQLEKQLRDLKSADYSKIADRVKSITAIGKTVSSLYDLAQTPMGQAIKKKVVKQKAP